MQELTFIVESCFAAACYALVFYAKKRQKTGEPFKPRKALSTVVVGVVIGFAVAQSGHMPSRAALETRLTGMAGAIAVVETLLKVAIRQLPEPGG